MEPLSFEKLWQLLAPEGEFCRRRNACEKRWESFSVQRQHAIYRILETKKRNGDYVSPNPYFALDDNDRPVFLSGSEQDRVHAAGIPLVMVHYHGRFLVCTRDTMNAYALDYIRDVI